MVEQVEKQMSAQEVKQIIEDVNNRIYDDFEKDPEMMKELFDRILDIPVKQEGVDYYTQLQKLCWKLHVHIEKSDRFTPSALIEKLQEWYDNRMADRRADKMAGTTRISMWCTGISVAAVVVTLFVTLFQSHHVHEPSVNHVHEPSEPTKQVLKNNAGGPKEPPGPRLNDRF